MTYEIYCQLIDIILLSDTRELSELDFILLEIDSKYGNEISSKVRNLYQANLKKDFPKTHVELYNAVCTELLSQFTLPRLFMAIYFATKYLALIEEIKQIPKDELETLRIKLSDELKYIIKEKTLNFPRSVKSWISSFIITGGLTLGLISLIFYQMVKDKF